MRRHRPVSTKAEWACARALDRCAKQLERLGDLLEDQQPSLEETRAYRAAILAITEGATCGYLNGAMRARVQRAYDAYFDLVLPTDGKGPGPETSTPNASTSSGPVFSQGGDS